MQDTLDLMHTHRSYVRVFFEHYRELTPDDQEIIRRKRDRYQQIVESTIERGVASGEFRDVDPRLTSFAVFGACNWAYQWYAPEGPLGSGEIAAFFADLLLTASRRNVVRFNDRDSLGHAKSDNALDGCPSVEQST